MKTPFSLSRRWNPLLAVALLPASLLFGGTALAKPESGQTFKSWTVQCEKPEGAEKETCHVFQNLTPAETDKALMQVAIGYAAASAEPVMILRMPLGVLLPPGLSLQIDKGESLRFPIQICVPSECRAVVVIKEDVLSAMRSGQEATITMHDATGRPVALPMSLQGFTAGLNAIKP